VPPTVLVVGADLAKEHLKLTDEAMGDPAQLR
jgi:hypothetical protein